MQRWFNYVCGNEVLMRDDEMVLFVESDFGYSPLVKRKQPATGVRRKILKQFAPPPDDTPELAEARPIVKLFYLGTMDAGHKVDKLVKARRGRLNLSIQNLIHPTNAILQVLVSPSLITVSSSAPCTSKSRTQA